MSLLNTLAYFFFCCVTAVIKMMDGTSTSFAFGLSRYTIISGITLKKNAHIARLGFANSILITVRSLTRLSHLHEIFLDQVPVLLRKFVDVGLR